MTDQCDQVLTWVVDDVETRRFVCRRAKNHKGSHQDERMAWPNFQIPRPAAAR